MNFSEACEAFSGPIPTLRTPYRRDGTIDFDSLRHMIDFDLGAGARSIVLTAGDSHLQAMSDREVREVTRAVSQHVNGRAVVTAADSAFDTKQAVAFAESCRDAGVDVLMVKPPDWAKSCTPETLAAHYAEIARRIPVMLVTNVFIARGEAFGLEALSRTLDTTDGVVAIKDDMGGAFARKLAARFSSRCAIWAGGQKQNHLNMAPYGAHGYLSTFLTFKPDVAHAYWSAWESKDLAAATAVVRDIDMPFFDFIQSSPGGFDAALHGVLELYGLAERWRPRPYYSLDDDELAALKDFLQQMHLL